jgi:hypothetical protein
MLNALTEAERIELRTLTGSYFGECKRIDNFVRVNEWQIKLLSEIIRNDHQVEWLYVYA